MITSSGKRHRELVSLMITTVVAEQRPHGMGQESQAERIAVRSGGVEPTVLPASGLIGLKIQGDGFL